MSQVTLLTGGNLGNVAANLQHAAERLTEQVGRVVACSSVRKSEPWGFEAEESFLNQVLVLETELTPQQILDRCLSIEQEFGRRRSHETNAAEEPKRYQSRTMDIDLLFYDQLVLESPELTLPHPRISERSFVLEPLCEVMPDFVHPTTGLTLRVMNNLLSLHDQ